MSDVQILNVIVQGGSFSLIVGAMVWAARFGAPAMLRAFEAQAEKFDAALARRDEAQEQLAAVLQTDLRALTDEVRELRHDVDRCPRHDPDRTGEHHPLPLAPTPRPDR